MGGAKSSGPQAERPCHPVDDLARTHVDQLGSRSVGALQSSLACQEIGEEVGHEQQPGSPGVGSALALGHELVQRVYLHFLDARGLVDTVPAHHLVGHAQVIRGPLVPVVERRAQQAARRVEQAVVHAPSVDPGPHRLAVDLSGKLSQSFEHALVDAQDVPMPPAC